MDELKKSQIENFLAAKILVMYGISATKGKMGNYIFSQLTQKGMKIIPIHKEMSTLEGKQCFKNISDINEKIDAAIICTKPDKVPQILDELKKFNVKNVWLHQGSLNKYTDYKIFDNFDIIIKDRCILMFAQPKGIHKFHAIAAKFFGKAPK